MVKYLIEIKNRFFLLLVNCFFTFLIAYYYKETLLFIIIQPSIISTDKNFNLFYFIYTDVTEIFSVYIKLIFFICFQIISMFFLYHIFIFFSFALFKKEYKIVKFFYKILFFIWFLSGIFSSNFIIPLMWEFFLSFQNLILLNSFLKIHFEAKIVEYFHFYTYSYNACLMYFQFLAMVFFILKSVHTSLSDIKKFRKLHYFCFIIFSTVVCPDVLNQFLLSIIVVITYEMLVLFFVFNKKLKIIVAGFKVAN